MATNVNSNACELISYVTIKLEDEFMAEDVEFQEFIDEEPPLQTATTELEDSHTDAQAHNQKLNLDPPTHEDIKTELILDEEIEDDKQVSDAAEDDQKHAPAISDAMQAAVGLKLGKDCKSCGSCKICLSNPKKQNQRTYKCGPRSFKERRYLKTRSMTPPTDKGQKFACCSCDEEFNSKSGLDSHMKVHTEDTHDCEICGASYGLKLYLERHLLRRHSGKTQQSTQKLQISDDENEATSDEEYLNDESDAESTWSMDRYQESPSRVDTSDEEKNEQRPSNMNNESSQPPSTAAFKCKKCPSTFRRNIDFKRHMIVHNKNKKHKFACHSCEKTFFSKSGFYGHMKLHTDDTHNCKVCGTRFALKSYLERHMFRCHSTDLPYKCLLCAKSFKTERERKVHKCSKDRQRFKCEFCYKDYATKSSLRMHTREHTGLPWQCRICEKKMSRKGRCRRHIIEFHKITDKQKAEKFIKEIPLSEDVYME